MKIQFPWRKKNAQSEFEKLEGLLESTLTPVAAGQEYLDSLRHDLVGKKASFFFGKISPKTLQMGMLGVGAALSAAFIMVAGLRWALSLLAALGLIQAQRQKSKQPRSLPNQPAL